MYYFYSIVLSILIFYWVHFISKSNVYLNSNFIVLPELYTQELQKDSDIGYTCLKIVVKSAQDKIYYFNH